MGFESEPDWVVYVLTFVPDYEIVYKTVICCFDFDSYKTTSNQGKTPYIGDSDLLENLYT